MNSEKQTKKNIKLLSDLIVQNLDAIYAVCSKSAKEFNEDKISLVFLRMVIDTAKPKLTKDEAINELIKEYYAILNTLFEACVFRSRLVFKNNDSITLNSLSFMIEHVKNQYKFSLKNV